MDPSIKSLTITGAAAEDAAKSRRPQGSRKKRPSKMEEEEFLEQAKEYTQSSAAPRPIIIPTNQTTVQLIPKVQVQPQPQVQARPQVEVPQAVQVIQPPQVEKPEYDGGAKVILKPAKNPRVKLQPKHTQIQSQSNTHNHVQTRKARRIRLSVSSLSHRFTRAKKVKDDMEKKSLDTIRSYLVEKGVIQEKSKAPEKMLRSMYKDFMLLKDTAL